MTYIKTQSGEKLKRLLNMKTEPSNPMNFRR